jgi:hypothetical protein
MGKGRSPKWSNVPLIDVPGPGPVAAREVVRLAARMTARERLGRLVEELAAVELDRAALVVERDRVVASLRAEGVSWVELGRLAGTSRQALMKRGGSVGGSV